MKNDTPKNAQAHLNSETDKPEKNKQKIIDKVKALDEQAKKLKAKEYRSGTQEDNNQNADLVANKTNHLHAENIDSSSTETQISGVDNPGENTTDHEALNHDNIESVTPQTDKPHVVVTEVVAEQEQQVHQGHRVGKGGGVTTPEGVSFSLTEGLDGGVLASGILGTSSKLIHHGVQPQVEGLSYPDGISASKNIVTAPEIAKNSAGETGTVTSVTKPDKSTQLIPEQISQTTAGETLSPKLSPDQTPQVSQQVIPLSATIQVDAITPDNILNLAESKGDVVVSGTVGGDAIDGDVISLTVNGSTFTGIVIHGAFNITIGGHELSQDSKVLAQITVSNPDGRTLTATDGQNYRVDTSIYTKDDLSAATEDQDILATSGNVLSNDDLDNTEVTTTDIDGRYGIYHFNPDGSYTYKLDNDKVQHLAEGQVIQDTVTYEIRDNAGNTAQAKLITEITGTNDQAIITGTSNGKITEDKDMASSDTLRVDGQLTVTDLDTAENQFTADSLQGQYGQLSIDNNGHWTYTANNSSAQIQGLNTGESLTDTLLVHSVDGTSQKITITINGSDDNAVITGTSTANLTEDKNLASGGNLRADGQLSVTDLDTAENQFTADSLQGQYGQLSIDNNGHWTYTANNSSAQIQGLNTGESLTDTLLVHSVDGTVQKITVTINGTDDHAVIAGTAFASLTEDKNLASGGTLRADGQLSVTDLDTAENQFSADSLQGQYGQLSIDNNGHWTYTANNSSAQIQGLNTGESLTDTLFVHSVDGTSQKITITINGSDDNAVITGTFTANLTEDKNLASGGNLRADGQLSVTDLDTAENQFTADSLQGQYGQLSIDNNGHWTYTANNSSAQIQGLKTGESLTDTLLVHSVDGTAQQVTVSINGSDDKAIIAGTATASLTEDKDVHSGQLRVDGALTVTDSDNGQAQFSADTLQGQFGTLSINNLGHWSYTADNSSPQIQGLKTGETVTESLLVHSVDGTEQTITITLNGRDDQAVISGVSTATLTEDKALSQGLLRADGQLTAVDLDKGENQFQAENIHTQYGQVSINNEGHWTYTADSQQTAIQGLTPSTSLTEKVMVHSVDGTQHEITVTIQGTTDAAVISGVDKGDVHEGHTFTAADGTVTNGSVGDRSPDHQHGSTAKLWNDQIHTEGHLNIHDADSGEANAQNGIYHGNYGQVILQESGDWSYYASIGQDATGRAIDKLGQGQSLTDTVTIKSADGTTHDIVITIHGDNDRPYCSSEVTLTPGTEDKKITLTASDLLANTVDVDANDAGKLSIENLHVDHGSISANADGSFTFSPAKDYNGAVHFTYDVKDAHGGVTHTGASTSLAAVNDASQLDSHLAAGEITEDNTSSPTSNDLISPWTNLDTTDVDSSAEANIVQIEINGVVHQVPANFAMNLQGNHGSFVTTHSTDGHNKWRYEADNSHNEIQGLKDGQSLTDSMTLITADGTRIPITATINGVDDHVIIDTPASTTSSLGTVIEDSKNSVKGTLLAHDSDTDDTISFQAQTTTGSYGTLTVNKDGSWHYDLDHAKANSLGASDNKAEGFDVVAISSDGSKATQHIQVNVQGTDDQAVITGNSASSIAEGDIGDNVTASGTLTITDVDTGDNPSFPDIASVATTYGHITMHNGQWTYTLDESKVQQLDPDEAAVVDHHTFTASDGSKQTVDITITGTNDKPIIESAHAAPVGASSALKLQDVAIIDSPTGANIDVASSNAENAQRWGTDQVGVASGVKLVGLYKPGSDHNWITHPATSTTGHSGAGGYNRVDSHDWWQNNGIPDTVNTGSGGASGHGNAWAGGIAVFEDSAGHQTIGIINRVCSGSGSEVDYLYYHSYQNLQVGSAQFSGSATPGETINVMDGNSKIASVVADSNGHWEVAASHLSDGQHTLHIENGTGQHSAEMVLQVAGHSVQNITPAGLTPELKEDSAQTTIDGELRATDVDHGDTASIIAQTNHATKYGHFSIDANGQYHYTIDNSNQTVNQLGVHQTLTEVIPVTSTSTDGTSVTTNVTITIQGSVDQPILNATAPDAQQGTSMALNLNVAAADTGGDHEDLLIKVSGLPDAATLNHGTHDTIAKLWTLHQSDLAGLELNLHDGNFHGDLHFNVTATASAGGESESTTQAVTLFVNAPPEVARAVTGSKTEDSGMGAIDLLAGATDADTGDRLSIDHIDYQLAGQAKTTVIPSYLTMGKDGHTLTINTNSPVFQHLAAGDTQTITMSYNVNDTHGGTVQQTATVTITGTNDSAVISGQATGRVIEDNSITATGTLTITDVDDNQASFNVATVTGTYGSLTIDAHGVWQYSLSTSGTSADKVQALPDGQKVTDTLQIQSVDGTVYTISIGVTGTNDQPTVSVQALNATEDSDFQFTLGNFGFTDIDTGDTLDHITLTALPDASQGELLLKGVAVSVNQQIDNADIANLTFKPVANFNGDVHLSYSVNDGQSDSAPAMTTLTVANVNDLPTVVATTQSTLEDTDIIISKAQLLSGSNDIDSGDVLDINSVVVNGGHGTLTDNGNGTWTLHPDTNFKGDITLNYKVNDGHANVDNHMTVNVSSVTDQADIHLTSSVQQEIITTGSAGRIQIDDIQAAAPLTEFTLEMTVIGKAVADTGASTGPVVVNMGHDSSTNMLSLWNPGNMKIGGAGNIATGINLGDGNSHRVTLTWDSASGDLKIFDNGNLAATATGYHKGGTLPADMYMVLGSKANGGIASPTWNANEHYEGSIFNTAIASQALTPAQVALGPLASQLNAHTGLLADVRSVGGSIQDTTGAHSLAENGVGHELHTVDTSVGVPPAGSLVNLDPQVSSPDSDDTITGITLHGLVKGTVLADGTHSHTISSINDTVDIKDWDLDHMTAQLPPAVTSNMNIGITATSIGPDGQTAVITEYTGLKLDPTRPLPNAVISGGDASSPASSVTQNDEPELTGQLGLNVIEDPIVDVQSDLFPIEADSAEDGITSSGSVHSPVDPYLDMLGLSKDETQSSQQSTTADDLFSPVSTSLNDENADPLVDDAPVDVFASPLDDDKRDDFSALDDSQTEQGLGEPLIDNDDDSLHQALIDMHSQI